MKRVMREVLPTVCEGKECQEMDSVREALDCRFDRVVRVPDCSPKKTNLNFLSGFV